MKTWKLHIYYNGIQIKTVRISDKEDPSENSYVIRVFGKKHLFGSNIATIIVRPVELLKTNERKREIYYGVIFERGADIS